MRVAVGGQTLGQVFAMRVTALSIGLALAATASAAEQLHHGVEAITDETLLVPMHEPVMLRQPLLYVGRDSCHPVPAVDAEGNWNGGLAPHGHWSGSCGGVSGTEVGYARMAIVNATTCVRMYAWFFEKNQGEDFRQRWDWQHVVIVSETHDLTSPVTRLCVWRAEQYSCWRRFPAVDRGGVELPLVTYHYADLWDRHLLDPVWDCHPPSDTDGPDGKTYLRLVDWDRMNADMQKTLNDGVFGDIDVPVCDTHFDKYLALALAAGMTPDPVLPDGCPHKV